MMYAEGKGITKDYKAAIKWFNLAAEQGDANAQSNLGNMYEQGYGVVKDKKRAHMWLNLSASQGNKNALVNRNMLELKMNPGDITKANKLARECVAKGYKGC
jgi:TPR repeat protein